MGCSSDRFKRLRRGVLKFFFKPDRAVCNFGHCNLFVICILYFVIFLHLLNFSTSYLLMYPKIFNLLEFYLWGDVGAFLGFEIRFFPETEHIGQYDFGEFPDIGIKFPGSFVESLSFNGDPVFSSFQLTL